jgi:hypothetical protein
MILSTRGGKLCPVATVVRSRLSMHAFTEGLDPFKALIDGAVLNHDHFEWLIGLLQTSPRLHRKPPTSSRTHA